MVSPDDTPRTRRGFGSEYRLKKRADIHRCKQEGRKVFSKHFLVLCAVSRVNTSRLAVAVTTKIDKRSAVRNKVRRRLKEFFRLENHRFVRPYDVLAIARSGSVERSFQEICDELSAAFTKAGLFAKPEKVKAS